MNETLNCTLCDLHKQASTKSVCLRGEGMPQASLAIFLDHPTIVDDRRGRAGMADGALLLKWLLARMSIPMSEVYIDYVLKCYPGKDRGISKKAIRASYYEACATYRIATLQNIKPKAIIAMGAKACEAFLGSDKVGNFEGTNWMAIEPKVREVCHNIWITYAPAYALQDPSETVSIYRTIYTAAKEAGLNPVFDKTPRFDYGI